MACEFTLAQITEATRGEAISQHEKSFIGVGTDSRAVLQGQIFVALRGENHDSHKFLFEAIANGAKCLIIDTEVPELKDFINQVTIVKVEDTLRALQDLAKYWRRKISAKVVGITGSNGKTSTKEFLATILSRQFKVCAAKGSFNNHWGVPLTLLQVSKFDDVAVIEMGMNHPGELTALSKIAEPDFVVCTTVGRAHVGNFEGSIQAVADAKEEIYLANPKAIQIFNYDNEYTMKMFERVSKLLGPERVRVFSSFSSGGAEVSLRATHMYIDGLQVTGHIGGMKGEVKVPVFGRQNVTNLMAAATIAFSLGMEPELIWSGLQECHSGWGRNQVVTLENGTKVLFDGYNANPDSTSMLVKNLFEIQCEGKKVGVFGEMLELGADAPQYHRELAELISNTDIEVVWFYGPSKAAFEDGLKAAGFSKTYFVSDSYDESLAKKVRNMLNPSDIVVMKGSRGMKLERVLQLWLPGFVKA